jgi:hypothetical protein
VHAKAAVLGVRDRMTAVGRERALPKAPNRVLALVGHGFALELICTLPFIEPGPGVAEDYERKTLVALSRVRSPALSPIATECSADSSAGPG